PGGEGGRRGGVAGEGAVGAAGHGRGGTPFARLGEGAVGWRRCGVSLESRIIRGCAGHNGFLAQNGGFSSGTGLPTGRTTCVVSVLRCRARSRSRRCSVLRRSRTWGRCRGVGDPVPQVRPFSAAFCWRRLVSGCTGGAWSASGAVGSVARRVAEWREGRFGPWTPGWPPA